MKAKLNEIQKPLVCLLWVHYQLYAIKYKPKPFHFIEELLFYGKVKVVAI